VNPRYCTILFAILIVSGCGDNTLTAPDAGRNDASPDAVVDRCTLLDVSLPRFQYNSVGQLNGLRYAIRNPEFKDLVLLMELYDESTGNVPKLVPGSFELSTAPNNNLATCQHCVYIAQETKSAEGSVVTNARLFQTSGTMSLSKVSDPFDNMFAGTFIAELAEVTIDAQNNSTPIANGRCVRVEMKTFDTTPTTKRCTTLAECPNEELQVCDPDSLKCIAPQCDIENGGCGGNQACVPQIESRFQGACYDICNPRQADSCGTGRVCKQTGPLPDKGLCLRTGPGLIGAACDVKDASSSCIEGLVCSAESNTCTSACNFFARAPATPGCPADQRCSLFGRCEPTSIADSAALGGACTADSELVTACAADSLVFQGYCFTYRDQDPLTCIEACLTDADCTPAQFCAPRFSSGLGTCLADPVCGDGLLGEVGEVCDDGNTSNGDTCSSDCKTVNYPASCAAAQTISNGVAVAGDTRTGLDGFFASCQGGFARTKLYTFAPPGPGRITVTIDSTNAQIAAIRTACANDTSEIGCELDKPDRESPLVRQLTTAAPVTVSVGAFNVLEQGPFTVKVDFVPEICGDNIIAGREVCDDGNAVSNDGCSANCRAIEYSVYCANAPVLSTTSANTGDTTNAPFIFDNDCSAPVTGRDRLYTFTAPRAGTLNLSLDQGQIDLGLAVFSGCGAPATLQQLACSSVLGPNEEASVPMTAGQKVTVVVDGFSNRNFGPYSLAAMFQ
jgi:cysteine-rich repeat protein